MWTPYIIRLVLHHHSIPVPFEHRHAPIYPETIETLCAAGILAADGETYTTTDLGKALVEAWCDTPIPIVKYVDPRFGGILREQVETKPHVVRVPLADGSMKEYVYPTRAKSRTKTSIIVKEFPTIEGE